MYYTWYYRDTSKEGFFALKKRNRSDSNLALLENQDDSNTLGNVDNEETVEYDSANNQLRLERNSSSATQTSHISSE